MTVRNTDIADIFERMADWLEIEGENPFKIGAYRNANRRIGRQRDLRLVDYRRGMALKRAVLERLARALTPALGERWHSFRRFVD